MIVKNRFWSLIALGLVFVGSSPILQAQTAEQRAAAQAFIDALLGQKWDALEALEHPQLREKIHIDEWKKLIPSLEERAGGYVRHDFHSAEPNGSYASVVYHAYFEKDSLGFRVVVDSINFVGGFWLDPIPRVFKFDPPSYADTSLFDDVAVTVGDSLKLPGVISMPKGDGPFPAVVLVHGSGPQDMDETIQGNKPFRDLAWGLASKGVIVLRYMKRTKVYGAKMNAYTVTVQDETIDDAIEGVHLLRARPETDTTRIVVAGHSLGGMLAPEIAASEPAVKGIALLAAIVRPLEVVIGDQLNFIAQSQDSLSVQEAMKLQHEMDKIDQISRRIMKPKQFFLSTPASYYYDIQDRPPLKFISQLSIPMFIARGTKDYQSPEIDFQMLRDSLAARSNVVFKTYPDCFHPFIRTEASPGPWNYEMIGHVVPDLIADLVEWIQTIR